MEPKDRTLYSLIILSFVLGLVIGYVVHQPGSEIEYITKTIEVPKTGEPNAIITTTPMEAIPTATAPALTSTPVPDFEVKIYDPQIDKPAQTIDIVNWKAMPEQTSIKLGETVLIEVINYPDRQEPPKFIMGSYIKPKLGTAGKLIISFNKKGTYTFEVVIPNSDPTILPVTYAKGSIRVY